MGPGCNGVIDILLEPLGGSSDPVISALDDRNSVAALTDVGSDDSAHAAGDRAVYDGETAIGSSARGRLPERVLEPILDRVGATPGSADVA